MNIRNVLNPDMPGQNQGGYNNWHGRPTYREPVHMSRYPILPNPQLIPRRWHDPPAPSYPDWHTTSSYHSEYPRYSVHSPPYREEGRSSRGVSKGHQTYSEEQRFFIMFLRILRRMNWTEIENEFANRYGQRSRGALTSVYYRIRKDYGLREVTKSEPDLFPGDQKAVIEKAGGFQSQFLQEIGYLEEDGSMTSIVSQGEFVPN